MIFGRHRLSETRTGGPFETSGNEVLPGVPAEPPLVAETVSTNRVITGEMSIVIQPSSEICGVRESTVPMVMVCTSTELCVCTGPVPWVSKVVWRKNGLSATVSARALNVAAFKSLRGLGHQDGRVPTACG